jgi:hypothetical protein
MTGDKEKSAARKSQPGRVRSDLNQKVVVLASSDSQ